MAKEGVHEGRGVWKEERQDVIEHGLRVLESYVCLKDLCVYLESLRHKAVHEAKVDKEKERTSKPAQHRETKWCATSCHRDALALGMLVRKCSGEVLTAGMQLVSECFADTDARVAIVW